MWPLSKTPRTVGAAIASGADNALDRLSERKRDYVVARAQKATIRSAAAEAGVSTRMGAKYEKAEDVQAAYQELVRRALPAKKLVELIKGGAMATMPDYTPNGKRKKKERPDWRTRKPYIDMAAEHAGFFEKKQTQNNTMISVRVEHVGASSGETGQRTKPVVTLTAEAE